MKKPVIGVVPLIDAQRNSYWMLPGYMKGIEQAGGIPLMLPLCSDLEELRQLAEELDGFLFTGGQDVSPDVYHAAASDKCGECCRERDKMEAALLRMAYDLDKPILGICRGIQLINAVLGGTLYQDLPSEHPSGVEHHQLPPYDIPCHSVEIISGSALHALLQTDKLMVNSYHHQAVRELALELVPMAFSPDGLVEAAAAPGKKFLWAVQWHPEFSYIGDESSRRIFQKFVQVCG